MEKNNVVSAITFWNETNGNENAFVGVSSIIGRPFANTGNPEVDKEIVSKLENEFGTHLDGVGHGDLDFALFKWSQDKRFRIYKDDYNLPEDKIKYYFTSWDAYKNDHWVKIKDVVDGIIKLSGVDVNNLYFESKNESNDDDGVNIYPSYQELFVNSNKQETPKIVSSISTKIDDLDKKRVEMESEEHVRGAQMSPQEKKRAAIALKNVEIEIAALRAALKSGETDVAKVVFKTVSDLDNSEKVIPSEELYRELERKLSHYGTSAAQILSKLRSMGLNPKTALKVFKEIQMKRGDKMTESELLKELEEYKPMENNQTKTLLLTQNLNGIKLFVWDGDVTSKDDSGPAQNVISDRSVIKSNLAGLSSEEISKLKSGEAIVVQRSVPAGSEYKVGSDELSPTDADINESTDYSTPHDPVSMLDLGFELRRVLEKNLKGMSGDEISTFRAVMAPEIITPDGGDHFHDKGTLNFYVDGLPPGVIKQTLVDIKERLKHLNVLFGPFGTMKPNTSGKRMVIRIPITSIPNNLSLKDLTLSHHFSEQAQKSLEILINEVIKEIS